MSYTSTPNYSLKKPNVNSDNDVWGDHLNQDMDQLDTIIHGIDTRANVTSFNTRTGAVTLQASDVTALGFATTTSNDASYVNVSGDTMAGPLTLSGNAVSGLQAVPLQQLNAAVPAAGNVTPAMDSVGAPGVSALYSRQDHVHPTDISRYAASNPAGYQTAAQVTTALAPYAPINSPAFTGVPTTAATPAPGDSSTKLATTAFVTTALSSAAAAVVIGDTPPASPQPGNLWFDSTNVSLLIRYRDPTGPDQWVVANNQNALPDAASDGNIYGRQNAAWAAVAPAAALNNAGRNLIHNALFNVAQRGAGPFTTSVTYTLDRWLMFLVNGTLIVSQQTLADANRTAIGDEAAQFALGSVCAGTAGAGDLALLEHRIEGVRRLGGKTVTVSFWAFSQSGTPKLGIDLVQSFGSGGSPSATVQGIGSQAVTLSTTFARYSTTITLPSTTGKTLGTNGGDFTSLRLWQSSGATNNGIAGGIGVQSYTLFLWGVQLEIGAQATPLEKVDPGDDLRRCQRFYQTGAAASYGGAVNGAVLRVPLALKVTMRAVPTMTSNFTTSGGLTSPSVAAYSIDTLVIAGTESTTSYSVDCTFTASADL